MALVGVCVCAGRGLAALPRPAARPGLAGRIHELRYALDTLRRVPFIPMWFLCISYVLGTSHDIRKKREIPGSGAGQTMIPWDIIGNHREIVRIHCGQQYLIIINAILSIW